MDLVDQMDAAEQSGTPARVFAGGNDRQSKIIRTSLLGVVCNALLAAAKLIIGSLTHSAAIISDGVNSLTDVLSTVLLIVGAKFANKRPNRKHPHGYGKTEYIITIAMGAIIIFAGASALFQAIWSIRIGQEAEYEPTMLVILAGAAVVKLVMGVFFKRRGRALNSDPLVASGVDSMLDAAITTATIIAALIFMLSGVSTEAYLAIVIALITLKAGLDVLLNAISKTLGMRVGVMPVSCADEEALRMRKRLEEIALGYDHVLDMHGFRVKKDGKIATFSVTADFAVDDRELLADEIAAEAERAFPGCQFFVTTVSDFTD